MDEFLNKIEETVTHNAMCYSKDCMETPKEGYEKEFAEAYNEMALFEIQHGLYDDLKEEVK